jgi:3-oxoacyl-[acyl-carrier-protein] synthase II
MKTPLLAKLLRDEPVWVTGAGVVSAAGFGVGALWEAVVARRTFARWTEFSAAPAHPRFITCAAPSLAAAECADALRPFRKLDRAVQLAALAAEEAAAQARIEGDPARLGVAAGSTRGPVGKLIEGVAALGARRVAPSLAAGSTFACLAGALAQHRGWSGPSATLSATCSSGAHAIAYAAEQIVLGKADAMLAGGAEACLHPAVLAQLGAARVLGSHADPSRACRPFDVARNGLVPGEGAAFLVLESARHASARGAKPLAILNSWATGMDDAGRASVGADGATLFAVMTRALDVAGLDASRLDAIHAHGTGTVLNDLAEARAVARLLGPRAAEVPCISTKAVTGHCFGATPAMEAVLCVEALRRQTVPPTTNCAQRDPRCEIEPLASGPQERRLETVMSNSLGFWGYHGSLIFSRAAAGG